jgi:gliding motility-associated-like protein
MNSIFISTFFFLLLFTADYRCAEAQSVSRSIVSSTGDFATFSEGSMSWTIGEVSIDTYTSPFGYMTQGFHQPDKVEAPVLIDFFIPQGFSPNGDGINDFFVIRGILTYPNNSIEIYNRWGNRVFEASPYQSNWDGRSSHHLTIGNNELPVGTYFYVLHPNDNQTPVFKGSIYLNK